MNGMIETTKFYEFKKLDISQYSGERKDEDVFAISTPQRQNFLADESRIRYYLTDIGISEEVASLVAKLVGEGCDVVYYTCEDTFLIQASSSK